MFSNVVAFSKIPDLWPASGQCLTPKQMDKFMRCVNRSDRLANSVYSDQIAPRSSLIRIYIICSGLRVKEL